MSELTDPRVGLAKFVEDQRYLQKEALRRLKWMAPVFGGVMALSALFAGSLQTPLLTRLGVTLLYGLFWGLVLFVPMLFRALSIWIALAKIKWLY